MPMLMPIKLVVNALLGLVQFVLGFSFLLKLFGAREAAPFVKWLYATAEPLLHPFQGMFPASRVDGLVIDFTILFAFFAYQFLGYLVVSLIDYTDYLNMSRKERGSYQGS